MLSRTDGQLNMDDESTPDSIRLRFSVSKKAFKQALGRLLRERKIEFTKPGIRLVNK
jgi:predicted RNA-binding protein (virulence factor B family)